MAVAYFSLFLLNFGILSSPVSEPTPTNDPLSSAGLPPTTETNERNNHVCVAPSIEIGDPLTGSTMPRALLLNITASPALGTWPDVYAPFKVHAALTCNSLYSITIPGATGRLVGVFASGETGTYPVSDVPVLWLPENQGRLARVLSSSIDSVTWGCGDRVLWFVFDTATYFVYLSGLSPDICGVHTGSSVNGNEGGQRDYSTSGDQLIHGNPFESATNAGGNFSSPQAAALNSSAKGCGLISFSDPSVSFFNLIALFVLILSIFGLLRVKMLKG